MAPSASRLFAPELDIHCKAARWIERSITKNIFSLISSAKFHHAEFNRVAQKNDHTKIILNHFTTFFK